MPWWEAFLDAVGVVAVLATLGLIGLFVRRRVINRRGVHEDL